MFGAVWCLFRHYFIIPDIFCPSATNRDFTHFRENYSLNTYFGLIEKSNFQIFAHCVGLESSCSHIPLSGLFKDVSISHEILDQISSLPRNFLFSASLVNPLSLLVNVCNTLHRRYALVRIFVHIYCPDLGILQNY